jgi:hypothetical protein
VIVATGARFDHSGYSPLLTFQDAGIRGASDATVIDPLTVLEDYPQVGKRVVVMTDSGDYTPLGIATLLAERDHEVELVTPRSHIGDKLYAPSEAPWLIPRAVQAGVRVTASSYLSEIAPGAVTINSVYGGEGRRAEVDTVVLSLMRLQNDELSRALADSGIPTQAIGDCMSTGEVDDAVYAGEKAARLIS